jgi:acyl-CoA hydrolase
MTLSIWYADGADSPAISPQDALAAAGLDGDDHRVTLGWTIGRFPWLDEPFTCRTMMGGYGLARGVNEGRIVAPPTRLSAVPNLIEADVPDLAVVSGVRRGSALAFGITVGWADVLARVAKAVVVEVDDGWPDLGAREIAGNVVAVVERPKGEQGAPAAARPADDIDLTIGALVAGLLPDDPTLQFGPGGIGEGIARAVDRPVRIRSGLVTDAMADLHDRGLLTAPVIAAYCWGGDPIVRLAQAGMLDLRSVTETHDLTKISQTPRFVGCNTAIQLGLDGAVNVERVRGRAIAGIGGHADFCAGASRSVGGLSVIAMRSTAGGASTIVPSVEVVSTARSDVHVVVTEHGVADLRGASDQQRAARLMAIAAPEHRDGLEQAWKDRS